MENNTDCLPCVNGDSYVEDVVLWFRFGLPGMSAVVGLMCEKHKSQVRDFVRKINESQKVENESKN